MINLFTNYNFLIFLAFFLVLFIKSPLFSSLKNYFFNEENINIEVGQTLWRLFSIYTPVDIVKVIKIENDNITIEQNGLINEVNINYLNSFKIMR
jgi:hypothetical protein